MAKRDYWEYHAARSGIVTMVQVRVMRVLAAHRIMPMPVCMWLGRRISRLMAV